MKVAGALNMKSICNLTCSLCLENPVGVLWFCGSPSLKASPSSYFFPYPLLYIYVYVCVYMHVRICVYVCVYMYIYIFLYIVLIEANSSPLLCLQGKSWSAFFFLIFYFLFFTYCCQSNATSTTCQANAYSKSWFFGKGCLGYFSF